MRRREFVTLVGSAAIAGLRVAHAQQGDKPRLIGVLMGWESNDPEGQNRLTVFRNALQGLGWTEGPNLRIEVRWTAATLEHVKDYATELVALAPDAILCGPVPPVKELSRLTSSIPIVFAGVSDPIGIGIVAGLARPGGNITGFSSFEPDIGGKWLQLLKEIAPSVSRVAVLIQTEVAAQAAELSNVEAAAPSLGVEVSAADSHNANEIERAITTLAGQGNGGLLVIQGAAINQHRDMIIDLAARHRLPAIYPFREFVTSGGLIYYGYDQIVPWRGAAGYIDRILRGEKPGDLPVQAPTKFELVINLKTAKALGLSVPLPLLGRADDVIE